MSDPSRITSLKLSANQARRVCKNFIVPLAHPDRFAILCHIINAGRPVSHAEIIQAIGISPSSLTQHLNAMSRFISQTRNGRTKLCQATLVGIGAEVHLWGGLHQQLVAQLRAKENAEQ